MSKPAKGARSGFAPLIIVAFALIAYPCSFGPACWISSRARFGAGIIPKLYRPIVMLMPSPGNPSLRLEFVPKASVLRGRTYLDPPDGLVAAYARLLAADGWRWRSRADFELHDGRVELSDEVWEWTD